MPEPEPELQATANLSPVSPSPVHSAASQVVPVLQDTVDTIDAMVAAAAAAAAATNGTADGTHDINLSTGAEDIDDIVDDDSLNDPYGEVDTEAAQPEPEPQELPDDSNDDYAKTFDSPIGPEEGEGEDVQTEDVSSAHHQFNDNSAESDHLTSRPSEPSHVRPGPGAENKANLTSQSAASPSTAKEDSTSAESPNAASADIQRLVADLTASTEPDSNPAPSAKAELAVGSNSLPSALPSSASLPPRPPLPHSISQSYASQHPAHTIAPPTPGQPSTYVATGPPAGLPEALSNLSPSASLNAPVAITSMTAPPYPTQAPDYTDRAQDAEYERQWDQFMADERQYMSEAKWDRFPEGSRIFIGTRSASGASKIGAHIFSTGNLSSDKVSKRDVFDLFHRFGRLAQISLKSAYGFVQYHTVEEGQRAMENLQGIEIKGRRIRESTSFALKRNCNLTDW